MRPYRGCERGAEPQPALARRVVSHAVQFGNYSTSNSVPSLWKQRSRADTNATSGSHRAGRKVPIDRGLGSSRRRQATDQAASDATSKYNVLS